MLLSIVKQAADAQAVVELAGQVCRQRLAAVPPFASACQSVENPAMTTDSLIARRQRLLGTGAALFYEEP
ncbi:MAG: hypothetical protein QF664_12310, partial [Dehalococcoidia bacterium]|nr:hypothetical protein [Dehalococcoidia bacterium]